MPQPATTARPALRFVTPANAAFIRIPYFPQGIATGFPSPADDHLQKALDLHEHLSVLRGSPSMRNLSSLN
jgi:hypothetical protein